MEIKYIKEDNSDIFIEVSPIASPIANKKLRNRCISLLNAANKIELSNKTAKKNNKIIVKGVAQVTKCIRKDVQGIVIFAIDVIPIDIISHLPMFCEEKNIRYVYLCGKQLLGAFCKFMKPTSVIMVINNNTNQDETFTKLYKKCESSIDKISQVNIK